MIHLIVTTEKGADVAFPISRNTTLVGRDSVSDIFLSHPSVSREHARIVEREGRYYVIDRGSLNGTFVNEKQVAVNQATQVKLGDEIAFGSQSTRLDKPPTKRTSITQTIPWARVEQAAQMISPDKSTGRSSLSLISEIEKALEGMTNERLLLRRFALILCDYIGARLVGFCISEEKRVRKVRWHDRNGALENDGDAPGLDDFAVEMALEGTAFVSENPQAKPGQSALLFAPLSTDAGVQGFMTCVSNRFAPGALQLATVIGRFVGLAFCRALNLPCENRSREKDEFEGEPEWIGQSEASKRVLGAVSRYALGDSPVIIFGESGTGKELIARYLHCLSDRKNGPYAAYNCAAFPAQLAESELFGHVKGAFTDAREGRKGIFERGKDGVVFLDEIGELPMALQAKLLRVLETKQVRAVGGDKSIHVDFRIICATNRDLAAMVDEGRFRADLYYRLNVLQIAAPPLRMRGKDIEILARHFVKCFSEKLARPIEGLETGCMEMLMRHPWPGNVRELRNAVERAIYNADGKMLKAADFSLAPQSPKTTQAIDPQPNTLAHAVAQVERQTILAALERHGWSKIRTASQLNITRQTLDRKIAQYGLRGGGDDEDFE